MDLGSRKLTGPPVTLAERVQFDTESGSAQLSLSNNGILAYATEWSGASGRVVWVDRGGRQTLVDTTWSGQFGTLDLAKDESRLAVTTYTDAGQQIHTKSLPAGPLARVTLGGQFFTRPNWHPDGRRLAYISSGRAVIQRADGSAAAETLVTHPRGVGEIEFAPDGLRFLVRTGGSAGARDIHLGKQGDSVLQPLVSGPADEFAPAVSPDGRWFAYVSSESGRNEVFVRSLDDPGAGRTQVSAGGGQEVRWAPSGRELFYRTGSGAMMAVEVITGPAFQARPPRRLVTTPGMTGDSYHHAYEVARDGRFLMINQALVAGNVVLVLNWQNELRDQR